MQSAPQPGKFKAFFSRYAKYLLLALLIAVPVFGFLDTLPIRIWDESRIAINAYEMYKDHDYIVTHYHRAPEMWNTKPPFLLWCQVFFMKIVGANEIAIRLPSAFAAFFTCVALMIVSVRYLKNFRLGFISVLVLITTQGYVNDHITRTGEYDGMLAFFTFLGCLSFFAFGETRRSAYLYWFFAALTLGVLTKGVAGLLFVPALFIYCLTQKQFKTFLFTKHFYFGAAGFLAIVLGYYLIRDALNPHYIATVRENELGGRFLKSQGNQDDNFWFYLGNFAKDRMADRYFLIPLGFLAGFMSKDQRLRKFTLFVLIMSLTFFIIISSSRTRLAQYDAPLYPFLAFAIALLVNFICEQINLVARLGIWSRGKQRWKDLGIGATVFRGLFLFLVFMMPYYYIWMKTYVPDERYSWDAEFYEMGYFLKNAIKGEYDLNNKHIVYDGYHSHNDFYVRILRDKGVDVNFKGMEAIRLGDTLITSQPSVQHIIEEKYRFKKLFTRQHVIWYEITGLQEL